MPQNVRLAFFSRLWGMIWFSICLHWEALIAAIRRDGIVTLMRLHQVGDTASANLFNNTSNGFIAYEDTTIVPSLVQAASGIVLELGPGPGNQLHRFNTAQIDRIFGIEPNGYYKDSIDAKVEKNGLQGTYELIVAGIEDSDVLRAQGISEGSMDTVLCIQVLCAVQDPKIVMREVWKLLKPGGKFIFWEHGWSRDRLTTVAQAVSNPAWSMFVGCHLTRNVLADILQAGEWQNPEDIEEPTDPLSLLPRIQGVLIKKARV